MDHRPDAARLRDEGWVTVRGITRADASYVGAPDGDTAVHAGDTLIIYGHRHTLRRLARRPRGPKGDDSHRAAVANQRDRTIRERDHDTADH